MWNSHQNNRPWSASMPHFMLTRQFRYSCTHGSLQPSAQQKMTLDHLASLSLGHVEPVQSVRGVVRYWLKGENYNHECFYSAGKFAPANISRYTGWNCYKGLSNLICVVWIQLSLLVIHSSPTPCKRLPRWPWLCQQNWWVGWWSRMGIILGQFPPPVAYFLALLAGVWEPDQANLAECWNASWERMT